jgi:hypothetical protein
LKSNLDDLELKIKDKSSIDYPKFTRKLDDKNGENGFDTIATFLQKRIFDHPEQSGASTFNPALFEELGLVPI